MDNKALAKEYVQKQKDVETKLAAINELIISNKEVPKSLIAEYKEAKDKLQKLYCMPIFRGVKQ